MATLEELEQQLETLKRQVELQKGIARLQAQLDDGFKPCPLCGGSLKKRGRGYPGEWCQQDNGHCGEWVLNPVTLKRGDFPAAHFIRTLVKNGRIDRFNPQYYPHRLIVFVAGQEVDVDPAIEYNLRASQQ